MLSNREKRFSIQPSRVVKCNAKQVWRCSDLSKRSYEAENCAKVVNGIEMKFQESLKE